MPQTKIWCAISFSLTMWGAIGLPSVFAQQASTIAQQDESIAQQDESITQQDESKFSYLDVFELEVATGAQISPDGKRIVYSRRYFDIMTDRQRSDLWLVDEDGTHVPFISGRSGEAVSPRWSPDGKRLVYVKSDGTKPQIFCYWMETRRSGHITRLTQSPSSITWSPSGKWLAFFMRVPSTQAPFATLPSKPEGAQWAEPPQVIDRLRYRADGRGYLPRGFSHLFVVRSDGGTPRQLTSGDFNHGGTICWSKDDSKIIISANRRDDSEFQPRNSELYEVDVATKQIQAITERDGPDSNPVLSSNGRYLGYLGFDDTMLGHQNNRLYVTDRSSGETRCLTESLDRSVSSPVWSDVTAVFWLRTPIKEIPRLPEWLWTVELQNWPTIWAQM